MSKNIPDRFENETLLNYAKRIIAAIPTIFITKAKSLAQTTKRIRSSKHKRHYGIQAAARNLRHMQAGTHGL